MSRIYYKYGRGLRLWRMTCIVIGFISTMHQPALAGQRPNVLYISIEDIAPLMGCYGNRDVKTPSIDALASRGVVFNNAYCQVAACNPSRASISTGLRPETTGVFRNGTDWRLQIPAGHKTLSEFFRDQGYETVKIGKIHHHTNLFNDPTEEAQTREDRFWTRKLQAYNKPIARDPLAPKAPRPDWLPANDYIVRSLKWGPSGLGDIEQLDGANAKAAATFIKEEHQKPFFMAVGFSAPHYPLHAPDKYFEMYPAEGIELAENPPDDLDDVPYRYGLRNTADHRWLDDDEEREVIAAYYACISYIDSCVDMLTQALTEAGLEDDTIIILWGDHGMHLGEHYLFRKSTLFEEAARVPLIVSVPNIAKSGTQCNRLVELIDLYPTLADLCNFEIPNGLEGISMKPLLIDPEREWKKGAFTAMGLSGQLSVRTDRWRYTEWNTPDMAELYDHQSDPHEFTNLAGKPEYAETVAELHTLLQGGWRAALPSN